MGSPDLWLWLAAITLIVVGIAGTLLPALPGAPLVLGGLLLAAWIDDFREVGYVTLTVLGALTLVTVVVDIAAAMMGAQRVGATRAGVIGSALGTIVGMFLGFAGLVIGPFVGALIGDQTGSEVVEGGAHRDPPRSSRVQHLMPPPPSSSSDRSTFTGV